MSESDPTNKTARPNSQPQIGDTPSFTIDRLSGLYLPSGYEKETTRAQEQPNHPQNSPLPVKIQRGWWPIILESLTLILTTATVSGALYYAFQAKIQAGANVTTARAAATQAVIADTSMRVSLRPYVEVGDPDGNQPIAGWILDKGKRTGIKIHFWNAGLTPGTKLRVNGFTVPGIIGPIYHLTMHPVRWLYGWRSVTGFATIPAHGSASVAIGDLGASQIEKGFADVKKTGQTFQVEGSFEYMNVFDEWCCESYCLTLDSENRFRACVNELRSAVCGRPDDVPNVCEQKGEMKIPY